MTPMTSTYQHNNTAPTGIPARLGDPAKREVHVSGEATLSRPSFLAGQTPNLHLYDHVRDGFQAIRPLAVRQHTSKGNPIGIRIVTPL